MKLVTKWKTILYKLWQYSRRQWGWRKERSRWYELSNKIVEIHDNVFWYKENLM